MSYCRWTTGDIYCYQSDQGWEVLIANPPEGEAAFRVCKSPGEAASFMRELKEKGVCVQMDAVEELEREQREMEGVE